MKNQNLLAAKQAKKDEFYTQLEDISAELRHYKKHFAGKTVYCNCDDPRVSKFFHFFSHQFNEYKLKRLTTTCYKNQDSTIFSDHSSDKAVYLQYDGFKSGDNVPSAEEVGVNHLKGDGDFRSEECIELLKQADIVVTNPPFSLFSKYVTQLMEHNKKFLILGNMNAIPHPKIFPFIKDGKIWLGVNNGGEKWFGVNANYDIATESRKKVENGKKFFSMGNVFWFTNLDFAKRHEEMVLYETYSPEKYPKYDNYDAIEVQYKKTIPMDYAGVMGVPTTFMEVYCPSQFEILGIDKDLVKARTGKQSRFILNGNTRYARIAIRNKTL